MVAIQILFEEDDTGVMVSIKGATVGDSSTAAEVVEASQMCHAIREILLARDASVETTPLEEVVKIEPENNGTNGE